MHVQQFSSDSNNIGYVSRSNSTLVTPSTRGSIDDQAKCLNIYKYVYRYHLPRITVALSIEVSFRSRFPLLAQEEFDTPSIHSLPPTNIYKEPPDALRRV